MIRRGLSSTCLFILLPGWLLSAACSKDTVRPYDGSRPTWIHLELGEKNRVGLYELYLRKDVETSASLYLKHPPDAPYRFLTKEIRSYAEIRPSRSGRLLLINAPCSPIARCVFVADADAASAWIVSLQARSDYQKSPSGPPDLFPIGIDFSPDEAWVLLRMAPLDFSLISGETDASLGRAYVADVRNGALAKTFKSGEVPEIWWEKATGPEDFIPSP